jgi:hypothetical protein
LIAVSTQSTQRYAESRRDDLSEALTLSRGLPELVYRLT